MIKQKAALDEARRLYALGFAIHWLHPKSKRPIEMGWTTGERKSWHELESSFKPGMNIGVRTGSPSVIGGKYLTAIDVDIHEEKYRKDAISALRELVGESILPCVMTGTGNGSRHLYCVSDAPFKMITAFQEKKKWEIVVYSDGRQMVLPPSIHPSGAQYKWIRPVIYSKDLPLLRFEDYSQGSTHMKDALRNRAQKEEDATSPASSSFELDSTFDIRWAPEISDSIRLLIERGIWKGKKITDRSAYLLPAASSLLSAGLSKDVVLTVLTDPNTFLGQCAYDHAQTSSRKRAAHWLWNYTVKRVVAERNAKNVFKKASEYQEEKDLDGDEIQKQKEEFAEDYDWRQKLLRTRGENGKIQDTLNNLDLILTNSTEQPLFQKNEFTNREVYAVMSPWGMEKGADLGDIDVILIKSWLANGEFRFEPKNQTIEETMSLLSHRHKTHPVRDWLNGLKWDGKSRIKTWIREYLNGQGEEPYLSEVSKKFLLAMVTRVFRPGCQWDYTLILEGQQGTRKSTAARVLASDKWFCDHLPDLKDKDAMLNLQGSWLVELGELKNVKHADAATVKAYLTRRVDRVRAPYGHRWIDAPRQSVFIGTVNENEYFKDPTGNRRFWPVAVGECDVERLTRDREQLFAEAKVLFDRGDEKLFLEGKALKQALSAQDDRRVDDDESEMRGALLEYMEKNNEDNEEINIDLHRFKMKELFLAPGAPWAKWEGKPYSYQVGAQVLRNLKFERTAVKGQRIWREHGARVLGTNRVVGVDDFY